VKEVEQHPVIKEVVKVVVKKEIKEKKQEVKQEIKKVKLKFCERMKQKWLSIFEKFKK
jgi:hypothetical protein